MDSGIVLCALLLLFFLLWQQKRQKDFYIRRHMVTRKKGKSIMLELVRNYIGKNCVIDTMDAHVTGTIKEVTDDWISVDNGKDIEIVNIGFIIRIREFPRGKNGKKKMFIPD